jgi:hypothetical protein
VSCAETPWKQRTPEKSVAPMGPENQENEVFPKGLEYREGEEYYEQ